ncbi:formate dehydrogenase accessory sulfurtransferase FdhD [Candidatus Uabimicrobium sp. HlEnr_7]|uniref:formate dehydrogenase accessory sulfurtransferase FdhD n=1 Tax=Candidatus Uabimicrobium helgolandensis TaxID=3095367 RepID=UPI0035575B56
MSIDYFEIIKVCGEKSLSQQDVVAIEEPLEIRLEYGSRGEREIENIAVTMRTPGNDFELALGFLFSEGIVHNFEQIYSIYHCPKNEDKNIVCVKLKQDTTIKIKRRSFYMTSSCGVCGKSAIEHIKTSSAFLVDIEKSPLHINTNIIAELPLKMQKAQKNFQLTGGIHATGLFDPKANLLYLREDIGRHNAFDKLLGTAFAKGHLPLANHIILTSSRASFELLQKSAMAGIAIFVAIGAPSSLAIKFARDCGITLIGFARNNKFNIYSNEYRISNLPK